MFTISRLLRIGTSKTGARYQRNIQVENRNKLTTPNKKQHKKPGMIATAPDARVSKSYSICETGRLTHLKKLIC